MENYRRRASRGDARVSLGGKTGRRGEKRTYQAPCAVDPGIARQHAVHPLGLLELPEPVLRHRRGSMARKPIRNLQACAVAVSVELRTAGDWFERW